jgi:DNA replication protein DnaC
MARLRHQTFASVGDTVADRAQCQAAPEVARQPRQCLRRTGSTGVVAATVTALRDRPGAGKSWLGCALAQYACRRGYSALYQRVPRLQEELRIRHASGTFGKWLLQVAKTDVLILDDWGMGTIDSTTRSDLLGPIDDRAGNKATILTSQLPIDHWHAWIGDATIADAILDRILQRHHRFTLT